jgi:hypothetical protein
MRSDPEVGIDGLNIAENRRTLSETAPRTRADLAYFRRHAAAG